ncbi:MAG: poly(A) polymerase [Halieaceae bacterium]|jgi:poly(A) polymerase
MKKNEEAPSRLRTVVQRADHPISRRNISDSALKVMSRLRQGGHESFLVGGAVRDLYLGGQPKDFDVATDATPEQVHELFRNSRIIGRRFRIVHVRFGREIIEVTTFRGHHDAETLPTATRDDKRGRRKDRESTALQSDSGMLLRDNVFGNVEEDALRRDFSVNALYYNPRDFTVHDYAGGIDDLERQTIQIIGDAEQRYREDPVRMLRAARFAAKLGFTLSDDTASPIPDLGPLLTDVPAARLFDEVLKLFMAGTGQETFAQLQRFKLIGPLFPALGRLLAQGDEFASELCDLALASTDRRIREEKPVTPAFLFAALLWPEVNRLHQQYQSEGDPPVPALHRAAQDAIEEQMQHTTIPRRFSTVMREIWDLQLRLPKRTGKRAEQVFEHKRFRAAYDFLLLREEAGENMEGLGQWWTEFQKGRTPPVHREPEPRRRRPRNRKPRPS